VEDCLYKPLNQRPRPREIPSDSHLIKFDFLIDLSEFNEVSHLFSLLPIEKLGELPITIDVVKVTPDQVLCFLLHHNLKLCRDVNFTFSQSVC